MSILKTLRGVAEHRQRHGLETMYLTQEEFWHLLESAERAERLEGELREARAALEFYANERHYDEAGVVGKAHFSSAPMEPTEYEFEADYGHRARLALGLTTIDPAAVSREGGEYG